MLPGIGNVLFGIGSNAATAVAEQALLSAANDLGLINVTTFSGGAEAFVDAMAAHPELAGRTGNVTYLSPGIEGLRPFISSHGSTAMGFGSGAVETEVTNDSKAAANFTPK